MGIPIASRLEGAWEWLEETVPARWRLNRGALSEQEKIEIRSERERYLFAGASAGLSIPKDSGGHGLGLRAEVLFNGLAARANAPEGIGRVGELGAVWAAEAVGAEQRLADLSVQYAQQRVQFGKSIGSFQAIKHCLADMHSHVHFAKTAVIWTSSEPVDAVSASRYALGTSIAMAESSIQVHGAKWCTWQRGLHFFRRSMLTRLELVQGLRAQPVGGCPRRRTERRSRWRITS